MELEVLLFARAREVAGAGSVTVSVPPGATTADVAPALLAAKPALAPVLPAAVLALNEEYVDSSAPPQALRPTDVLAVIPPISGG